MNLLTSTATDPLIHRLRGRFFRSPEGEAGEGAGEAGAASEGEEKGEAGDKGEGETALGGAGEGEAGAKKGGEAGEGEGKGASADAAAGPPDKYELTPPDGFENIDSEVLAEAEPTLKELNLSNEQAQKLVPIAAQLVKKTMDRAEQAITERAVAQRKEWSDAFENDPAIGGANKAQTVALAAKAFDHYGIKPDTGVRQFLNESGLGNHPDLIRLLAGVGRDLEEGSFEKGDTATTPKAPEAKVYGPEFQPKG
jgi:hypothetical protein